jgi:hypothetical protein
MNQPTDRLKNQSRCSGQKSLAGGAYIRRECLDRLLFGTAIDLETKLIAFKDYYNGHRSHSGLKGKTPIETFESKGASLRSYRWRQHCRGLYQTPMAA